MNLKYLPKKYKQVMAFRMIASGSRKKTICSKCQITEKQYEYILNKYETTEVKIIDCAVGEFSEEFIQILDIYKKIHGCYLLYNQDKEIIYIGNSYSLGDRVNESIQNKKGKVKYVKLIETSMSDAYILEMFLINTHKPKLNTQSKGWGEITFECPTEFNLDNYNMIKIY